MNKNKSLHIVSFAIPYPPDYGGIIDVFYKIKALWKNNIEIILHCFDYDRSRNDELLNYCKEVHYYPRKRSLFYFFSLKPFIVRSRANKTLLKRLLKDDYPVLFEGLHSSFYTDQLININRTVILRAHNVEYNYYQGLAGGESHILKKFYYYLEAIKIKNYEKKVIQKLVLAAISPSDYQYFHAINPNTIYLPVFHSNDQVHSKPGRGNFILFHGNLSVNENISAVKYILKNICSNTDYPFIIAGKNPPRKLIQVITKHNNVELIQDPSEKTMKNLIRDAHIHLLITFQDTGIKLKLINALFGGRFCLANPAMVKNTPLEPFVHIADTPQQFVSEIHQLMKHPFTEDQLNNREHSLLKIVNNHLNAQKLITLLELNL
ncbi:MAG: glycosyltransferase family 1 protein [Bacteroidales bacterium]|jgi:hypothetical protein|nr:glycosyltransferase family 1 protein [Bacteroidales bacterium]